MSRSAVSRRAVLAGAPLAGFAACERADNPAPPPARDPDLVLRREVASDVERLLDAYAATLERHPDMGTRLRPLMSEHDLHLRVLRVRRGPARSPSATPTASVSASGSATGRVVAERAADALAALARAEREAAGRRVPQVVAASPALARIVAAIGASEAAHAMMLSRLT